MKTQAHKAGKKDLWELLKETNKARLDYNIRKWETIKFFQSIFSALTVAAIGGVIALIRFESIDWVSSIILALLPLINVIALTVAIKNLKRETKLGFTEEGTMFKILSFFEFEKLKKDQWLPGDETLLPIRFREWYYGLQPVQPGNMTFEQWTDIRAKENSFYLKFKWLFLSEIAISIFFIVLIVLLNFN